MFWIYFLSFVIYAKKSNNLKIKTLIRDEQIGAEHHNICSLDASFLFSRGAEHRDMLLLIMMKYIAIDYARSKVHFSAQKIIFEIIFLIPIVIYNFSAR